MTELQTTLHRLGDALERAADADLHTAAPAPARRRRVSTVQVVEYHCVLADAPAPAVDQQIIGAGFLGEYAPSPGQG
jgi:hypothetical protein